MLIAQAQAENLVLVSNEIVYAELRKNNPVGGNVGGISLYPIDLLPCGVAVSRKVTEVDLIWIVIDEHRPILSRCRWNMDYDHCTAVHPLDRDIVLPTHWVANLLGVMYLIEKVLQLGIWIVHTGYNGPPLLLIHPQKQVSTDVFAKALTVGQISFGSLPLPR
jgi:hypothetical protein